MHRFILALTIVAGMVGQPAGAHWRQFRGSDNRSVSHETGLPERFDVETGEHIAWKTPLPGRGASGPIVVGDRVIVTASEGVRQDRLHVLCFDAATGDRLWHRQLWATGSTVSNPFGAVAAPTPASDGELVFAFFGSNDLACFDLDGNLKWFRGLTYESPLTRNDVGMASSPLVVGDVVVVQMEAQGAPFAAGIDKKTGETTWRIDRTQGSMWTSPTLLPGETPDRDLVLLQGRDGLTAHDPRTGAVVWAFHVPCHSTSSVTADRTRVYLQADGLNALRPDRATGEAELLWHELKLGSGAPSAVVHQERVYVLRSVGIVCADARDGAVLWQLRMKGPFWATPVLADGRLYCVNHGGLVQVVELGEKGRIVADCMLEEGILGSPAVAPGTLYFRSNANLWKIGSGGSP